MTKTLVRTYCVNTANGDFEKHNLYYNTGILPADYTASPLTNETIIATTCSLYTIADGTILETYCALDNSGKGVRRTVTSSAASLSAYAINDTPDVACNGACDLLVTYKGSSPTTTTKTDDGTITIEASTSHPPVTVYIAGLGSNGFPTTTTVFNKGSFPEAAQYVYKNVPAGSYSAILQDAGNCSRASGLIEVLKGSAPGTGGLGAPTSTNWFKFELVRDYTNVALLMQAPKVRGYAWDNSTKQAYYTEPYTPVFANYSDHLDYKKGDIVQTTKRTLFMTSFGGYYVATQDMKYVDYPKGIPNPTSTTGYWTRLDPEYSSNLVTVTGFIRTTERTEFFKPTPTAPNPFTYYYYDEGTIVRHDWAGFYRAKRKLQSTDFAGGRIPAPTVGKSNDYWEKVEGYDHFYWAADEFDIIDQYQIGTLNRRVRFHAWNPEQLYFTPSTSNYFSNKDNDFVMFDDSTPSVETGLGDLIIRDITTNDIDELGQENGSAAVFAETPTPPLRYTLRKPKDPAFSVSNTTGIFENLAAADYEVDVYDANDRHAVDSFTIEASFAPRWLLSFPNYQQSGTQVLIFERGWTGTYTDVTGTDNPVELSWSPGGENVDDDLPVAVGAILDLNVYTSVVQQFIATIERDDRNHRVDYYQGGALKFRGYLDTKQYREALLGAGQRVTITATDGLGQLSRTKWANHRGERQLGRSNMLSVVLKCLSYCDVNLPVYCGLNLRDKLMSKDGDPLLEAYIHRNAFNKKDSKVIAVDDFIDARTVLDAVLKGFNAFLCQADGCWKIISLSEAHTDYAVRVWSPAGTLLTGVDTTSPPLHILPDQDATGANDLFWINGGQEGNAISAAQLVQASVDLQQETSLFRNGDFVEWNSTNTRPNYWTLEGNTTITREKGEKAKEYAVKFADYGLFLQPSAGLLSPPAPHIADPLEEDGMQVKFKATLEHTTQNPADLTATLYLQVVCDGLDFGAPYPVELSTKDKWKEHTVQLRTGLPGKSVRIRVLPPVATDTASKETTVRLNYLYLSIRPGLDDWSDVKEDLVTLPNPDAKTGILLNKVELALADLPRLANKIGEPLPPKLMDIYAWRHAISLQDFTATTGWARPGAPLYTSFLDNAAQDRLALRSVPARVLTGEVMGPGIARIRVGLMLDAVLDLDGDGKYIITDCRIDERLTTAQITARKLADGDYSGPPVVLPNHVRIAYKRGRKGARIADNGQNLGYRVSNI